MGNDTAFLLVGAENSGKTSTIEQWCIDRNHPIHSGINHFITPINGKDEFVYVVNSSMQEKKRYDVDRVRDAMRASLDSAERSSKGRRIVLLMAVTIGVNRKSNILAKDAVEETKKVLEESNYNYDIKSIYLKRDNIPLFNEIDSIASNKGILSLFR